MFSKRLCKISDLKYLRAVWPILSPSAEKSHQKPDYLTVLKIIVPDFPQLRGLRERTVRSPAHRHYLLVLNQMLIGPVIWTPSENDMTHSSNQLKIEVEGFQNGFARFMQM